MTIRNSPPSGVRISGQWHFMIWAIHWYRDLYGKTGLESDNRQVMNYDTDMKPLGNGDKTVSGNYIGD